MMESSRDQGDHKAVGEACLKNGVRLHGGGNRRPPDHLPEVARHQRSGIHTFLWLQPGADEVTVRAGDAVLVMGP